jgi:hypothetical protein
MAKAIQGNVHLENLHLIAYYTKMDFDYDRPLFHFSLMVSRSMSQLLYFGKIGSVDFSL